MNRILRPILSIRTIRAFIFGLSTLACTLAIGQGTGTDCLPKVINLAPDDVAISCNAIATITTADIISTATDYQLTGASALSNTLPISLLPTQEFFYGVSGIILLDMNGAELCRSIVFVNDVAQIPEDLCDTVTVDLALNDCMGTVVLPDDIIISETTMCEGGIATISTISTGVEKVYTFTSADLSIPPGHTVYVSKLGNTADCTKNIGIIDTTVPLAACPADETVLIAPACETVMSFDADAASTIPCGGSLSANLGSAPANGTLVGAGTYTYMYEVYDLNATTVSTCSSIITVEESTLASTSLSCVGSLNVSIDETCSATITVPNLLTGSTCLPTATITLSVIIDGIEQTGPSLTFTADHVGQSFDVSVVGPNGLNSCWTEVTIEDKLGPAITCPADVTILCSMPTDTAATAAGFPTIDNIGCDDTTISWSDAVVDNGCEGDFQAIIRRTFIGTDSVGNMGEPCTQIISVERESLISAVLPPHWDGLDVHTGINDNGVSSNPPLSCDGAGEEYSTITREDGRIVPSPFDDGAIPGTGYPGDIGTCGTIFSFYEDIILDICDENCGQSSPSYKVLRTWDIFDWCTGNSLLHQQIIKVLDTIAPEFEVGVPDLTVSTDLWGCGATIDLPTVSATDNCSDQVRYTWNVTNGTYDPVTNQVYVASNALTDVGDEVLLIAYAEDCCGNIVADTGLVTIVDQVPPVAVADQHTVVTLNNQSEDGHTKVYASTFDDGSWDGCGPIDWWVRRMDNACVDFDGDPDGEIDEVADFHKVIHFCCNDLEENQMVVFMVCDDGDRDGEVEMNGDDNCTTAMIEVDVQDKLAPTINCPAPAEINCIEFVAFEGLLDTELSEEDMMKLNTRFGSAFSNSTCGELGAQTFVSNMDEVCGIGAVTRNFVVNTDNGSATCSQTISITLDPENVMTCDRIAFPDGSEEELANYDWCDPEDAVTPLVTPIQVFECGGTSITEPIINRDNLCTEVGINLTLDTFDFAGGACIKILAHWEVIDKCLFEENFFDGDDDVNPFLNENGYYELYVEYDIFDTDAPDIACEDVTIASTDCEIYTGTLSMTATDDCTDDALISITYKVDVNADGDYDYPVGGGAAEGGTFDASELEGGLAIGEHRIKWIAYDGCGNYSTCEQVITIAKQDKEPTPYCHLGLSSAVMDSIYGCSVEMWATDFVAGGFDQCNLDLTYLMIPYQDIYGDPADLDDDLSVEDALDMAMPNWEFDCRYIENGEAHVVEIRIYTINSDGLYDYCDASLTLNDNFDCCPDLEFGQSTMISGNIATADGSILESVDISIMSDEPEFPRIQSSSVEGGYVFNGLKYAKDYELSANSDNDPKKGVTTLDLVLIQRHILRTAILDTPYKVIAADINGNGKISGLDLLQLRKLILGLYPNDQLPDNKSWRFVDNAFEFNDVMNPFPFVEKINVNDLSHAMYNQNFIGVKTGDVNGSYTASANGTAEVRSGKRYLISANDVAVSKGSQVELAFTASDLSDIYGMQLGLSFDNKALKYNSVVANALNLDQTNLAVMDGEIRISWNDGELANFAKDEVLFTLQFEGLINGQASEFINLDKDVLSAEAYNRKLEAIEVELSLRSETIAGFELLQNEPNPFAEKTSISFNLPVEGQANVRVFDVTGKVVLERSGNYPSGMNTMVIEKGDIGTSGILYYQLTYGNESATRKMILLD